MGLGACGGAIGLFCGDGEAIAFYTIKSLGDTNIFFSFVKDASICKMATFDCEHTNLIHILRETLVSPDGNCIFLTK